MENNTTNTVETTANTALTAKEIFVQLTILQTQLTEYSQTSLHRLSDAIDSISQGEDDNGDFNEQVSAVCDVFGARETTLSKLLEMYEKMYYDMQQEKSRARQEKIEAAKELWYSYLSEMSKYLDEPELIEEKNYVRSQIDLLVMDIMADKI